MNERCFISSYGILIAAIWGSMFVAAARAGDDVPGSYPTKVWGELSGGEMNISSFVFR